MVESSATVDDSPWSSLGEIERLERILGHQRSGRSLEFGPVLEASRIADEGRSWGADRTVSAETLARVLLTPNDTSGVPPLGPQRLVVIGARIEGRLDVGCGTLAPFLFTGCFFDEAPNLNDCRADFVGFSNCALPGLEASRLDCRGPLWLTMSRLSGRLELGGSTVDDIYGPGVEVLTDRRSRAVDLTSSTISRNIFLPGGKISGGLSLFTANVGGTLDMSGLSLAGDGDFVLSASRLEIGGSIRCNDATITGGGFQLEGARIGGSLQLVEARIEARQMALHLDHAEIRLGVMARKSRVLGSIHMHHAKIECQVNFASATIESSAGRALRGDHLVVNGSLLLNGGARVKGPLALHGAEVECSVNLYALTLDGNGSDDPLIDLDGAVIRGSFIADRAKVSGLGFMRGLTVGHQARFVGSAWGSENSEAAVVLDNAELWRGIVASGGFSCSGPLSAVNAKFGSVADFRDAKLTADSSRALNLSGCNFDDDLWLDRSRINGTVDLAKIHCAGDVRFVDSRVVGSAAEVSSRGEPVDPKTNRPWRGSAVRLIGGELQGTLDVQAAQFEGSLDLRGATVGRSVNLEGSSLTPLDGLSLAASGLETPSLDLRFKVRIKGGVDLRSAHVGTLVDGGTSWPEDSETNLVGLTYDNLDGQVQARRGRLDWLESSLGEFHPQPYRQLSVFLEKIGDVDEARRVRRQALKHAYARSGAVSRSWGLFQNAVIGFGYAPLRALAWAALFFVGGWLFLRAEFSTCVDLSKGLNCSGQPLSEPWRPWLVALDALLPVVRLESGSVDVVATPGLIVILGLNAIGWILVSVIAVCVGRHIKRT